MDSLFRTCDKIEKEIKFIKLLVKHFATTNAIDWDLQYIEHIKQVTAVSDDEYNVALKYTTTAAGMLKRSQEAERKQKIMSQRQEDYEDYDEVEEDPVAAVSAYSEPKKMKYKSSVAALASVAQKEKRTCQAPVQWYNKDSEDEVDFESDDDNDQMPVAGNKTEEKVLFWAFSGGSAKRQSTKGAIRY